MKKILLSLLIICSIKCFAQPNYQLYKATIGAGLYFKTIPSSASSLDSAVYVDRSTGAFQVRKLPAVGISDSTDIWLNDIRRRSGTDTVEKFKNGVWQFAYIDSGGISGITSINSQSGLSQTIAGSNGITVNSSSNTHTLTLGGTLTGGTTINGAGNAFNLGANGSNLSFLNFYANKISFNGPVTYSVEDYSSDADHTLSSSVTVIELHDILTANRTLTMPTPSTQGQTLTLITRYSAGANHFNLASAVSDNSTGSTFTQLDWGKTYDFYVNSSVSWILIRKY